MNKEELEGYVKTSINNCFKKMAEEPEEFFDNYKLLKKYNKVIKENIKLKQGLNEIREYIDNHKRNLIHPITHEEYEVLDDENIINILQIIDKVGDKK